MLEIRRAVEKDKPLVWKIVKAVIATGTTYVYAPDSPEEKMVDYWFSADKKTYVALDGDEIVGTFYLKDNQPDLGSHVANAGYMVSPKARGKRVGRQMAEFSLLEAKGSVIKQCSLISSLKPMKSPFDYGKASVLKSSAKFPKRFVTTLMV